MQPGEQLNLTNGKGLLATAVITHTGKKSCTVSVTASETTPPPERHTTIAISLLKNTGRFEWFLEKAAELGISEIIPLQCRRTEKQQFRHDRMLQILTSAMLQSRQTYLVQLHEPMRFEAAIQQEAPGFIAHCYAGEKNSFKEPATCTAAETHHFYWSRRRFYRRRSSCSAGLAVYTRFAGRYPFTYGNRGYCGRGVAGRVAGAPLSRSFKTAKKEILLGIEWRGVVFGNTTYLIESFL